VTLSRLTLQGHFTQWSVYSCNCVAVIGLCWRSVIFGMPGTSRGPLLLMLVCLIFWAYPVYAFKVKWDFLIGFISFPWIFCCHSSRIEFMVAMLTYEIFATFQPTYLCNTLLPYRPACTLQSSVQQLLQILYVNSKLGQCSFSCCSPNMWNENLLLLKLLFR